MSDEEVDVEENVKTEELVSTGSQDGYKTKQGFLVKCPMYCRINCANKHHPLLVALLNCKDTDDVVEQSRRVQELKHVVIRYELTGKWFKDDPIPDSNESYRYPMIHWAAALGFVNALKWLLQHGTSVFTHAEAFGNETSLQKALLCLQETCPNECHDKFEQIINLLDDSLLVTDSFGSTVAHTCAEYMANDIPKFQYFQHCLFNIIFHLRSKGMDTQLLHLMEMQNAEGNTCLHILCRNDKCGLLVRSILRETISHNPVVTIMRNEKEQRPVDIAKIWGNPRIFRFLTKMCSSQSTEIESDEEDWQLYPTTGPTGKPIDPINAVFDRKGNVIGEKLPPVIRPANVVYDKRGNIIGEKLELSNAIQDDDMGEEESVVIVKERRESCEDMEEPVAKKQKTNVVPIDLVKKMESVKAMQEEDAFNALIVKKRYSGPRRGRCGHFMAEYDKHLFCFPCREKCKGDDPCSNGKDCLACNSLSKSELEALHRSRKVAGLLANNTVLLPPTSQASTSKTTERQTSYEKSVSPEPDTSEDVTEEQPSTSTSSPTELEIKNEVSEPRQKAKPEPKPKSSTEFISLLQETLWNKSEWKPGVFSYQPMLREDFKCVERLISQCGSKLKEEIAFNLEQDHISIKRRLAVICKTEEELSTRYEHLQDGQMKLVIEVQKLLHIVNRLRREEKNLMDAIHLINGEINTTHTTHHGLKERLMHCKAALNVLNEIYDGQDSNDSDN